MIYTSFALLVQAGTLMEVGVSVLAAVLALSYGSAVWRAAKTSAGTSWRT